MAITRKTKTKKKNKKITLSEFRAWLEGVEELQLDDWSPTNDQWALIRNKINNIIEEVIEVETMVELPTPPVIPLMPSRLVPSHVPPATVQAPQYVPMPSSISAPAPMLTPGADGKLPTPNIDSSDGQYDSGFE